MPLSLSLVAAPTMTGFPGASADSRADLCHQCQHNVALLPSIPIEMIVCPFCRGGFSEEFHPPPPSAEFAAPFPIPNPFFPFASGVDPSPLCPTPLPFLRSLSSNSFELRSPRDLADAFGPSRSPVPASPGPAPFDPLLFLQDYMHQLVSDGANIQVILDDGSSNYGDLLMGPDLEQLIQQLAENDPYRYGAPAAAKSATESLLDMIVSAELIGSNENQCAVCMDVFEIGDEAKQMPCKHLYHRNCLLPWLGLHNSCPVCRFELPTDDPDYEQRRGAPAALAAPASAEGNSGGSESGARRLQRTFSISMAWPLRPMEVQGSGGNVAGTGDGNERNSNPSSSQTN